MKVKEAEKITYLDKLRACKYDPNKKLTDEPIIFTINRHNIGSLQNIVTVSGLPKQGKTTFIGGMIASALMKCEILGMKFRLPEGRDTICHIDTEQGEHDYYKLLNDKIKKLCNISEFPHNFESFHTREHNPYEVRAMIDAYLSERPNCSLLFLDGIIDLLDSFNDERESMALIRQLKAWTKRNDLLIINVLHRRKDNATTLGHIGSAVDRASQSILTVEKTKERATYLLKPEYLRSAPDFPPIEIFYNTQLNQWEQTFYTPEPGENVLRIKKKEPLEYDIQEHKDNIRRIFNAGSEFYYDELVQNIKEFYAVGEQWAKRCVKYLFTENLIYKLPDGRYTNVKQAKLYIQTGA